MYPHRFTNIHMFVQRIADNVVKYGYRKYVTGTIPEGRDPLEVDAKILAKYGINVSRWSRYRRKEKGQASIHYARHQEFFVMFAPAQGEHRWYDLEQWQSEAQLREHGSKIRDIASKPLARGGYTISLKHSTGTGRVHPVVRIHPNEYRALKAYYLHLARHRSPEKLVEEFARFPFEPWAGVKLQRWNILQAVNKVRRRAGFKEVDGGCFKKTRTPYKLMVPECCELIHEQHEVEAA